LLGVPPLSGYNYITPRRAGLSATAGLSCYKLIIVHRYRTRSEELYSQYSGHLSCGRHLYSGYTLPVLLNKGQELQVWMQSRIPWRWHQLYRYAHSSWFSPLKAIN